MAIRITAMRIIFTGLPFGTENCINKCVSRTSIKTVCSVDFI